MQTLILAAGRGKRMFSQGPKVLEPLAGQPLIDYLIHAISPGNKSQEIKSIAFVLPPEDQSKVLHQHLESFERIVQRDAKGTGDALKAALEHPWGQKLLNDDASFIILPGDAPLLSPELIQALSKPLDEKSDLRLLSVKLPSPQAARAYGRVLRDKKSGNILGIREHKDASPSELNICEVACSMYQFKARFLAQSLSQIQNTNAQNEWYLTDTLNHAHKIESLVWDNIEEIQGVNDRWDLALAEKHIWLKICEQAARAGCWIQDPWSTKIDLGVELEPGCIVESGVILKGKTKIARGVRVGAYSILEHCICEAGVQIGAYSHLSGMQAEQNASIGPYARVRPGSKIGRNAKLGNFVEMKNSLLGSESKMNHLSYLGDAQVGQRVNLGAGFITANYDGQKKHSSTIEDEVFMGSQSQIIAPIKIGAGSIIAAGSTVTHDVEAGSLVIARAQQVTKLGRAPKKN